MTPHNEAQVGDIAKTVLMPGDPLRAKYIAENYLQNARVVNTVRNMYGFTGTYKGKEITVFASGMGMPSMGIYAYELYKFYGVENIIRIGSCGAYTEDLNLFDTILVDKSFTEGNYSRTFNNVDCHIVEASSYLNSLIKQIAQEDGMKLVDGNVFCSEVFDYYMEDLRTVMRRFPTTFRINCAEMESFALFYIAKYFHKKASCLLTVVDSHYKKQEATFREREVSLNNMVRIALDTAARIQN